MHCKLHLEGVLLTPVLGIKEKLCGHVIACSTFGILEQRRRLPEAPPVASPCRHWFGKMPKPGLSTGHNMDGMGGGRR